MGEQHPLSAYPLKGEHTPPHVAFLFPYFIAQLIRGNSSVLFWSSRFIREI